MPATSNMPNMPDMPAVAAPVAHLRSPSRLPCLLFALLSLLIPATAWGDIYKWTDERGRTVLSNIPPTQADKASNVQMVMKETRAAAAAPVPIPGHVATPTEQALLARIESMERELQALRAMTRAPTAPPPMPYGGNYAPAPPPPPYYAGGYASGYAGYPAYYGGSYAPYVPAYSYAAYPTRIFVSRPGFVTSHRGSFRAGGGHRGRR